MESYLNSRTLETTLLATAKDLVKCWRLQTLMSEIS